MVSFIVSCNSDDNSSENYSSEKNDITAAEAKNFLDAFTAAKSENKQNIVKDFSKKNRMDINESNALTQMVLNTYTPAELASIIPVYGGKTGILPTWDIPGTLIRRTVEWNVVENTMGLWRVKSYEDITYSLDEVRQALHVGTRFEGLTGGLISWEEFVQNASIQTTGMNRQVLSIVRGTIHITGFWDSPVDNYCVFSIY